MMTAPRIFTVDKPILVIIDTIIAGTRIVLGTEISSRTVIINTIAADCRRSGVDRGVIVVTVGTATQRVNPSVVVVVLLGGDAPSVALFHAAAAQCTAFQMFEFV
ncbi:MAG TPA: hypothetical protein VE980_25000 [Pyrinomonadaceae bacterium]|nr:hypothetical protein [Pyrinomonadaceae bacterium]